MKKLPIERIWIFRILAVIFAPLLFLLLVEGTLRLVGYGYPSDFFIATAKSGQMTGNPRYTHAYFPKALAREPDLFVMDCQKKDGTYRIFVLGGSAARGTPEARFSFGRILEVMLQEAYPERSFEVVNTGMVAINSHVVMRIARNCANYDPDLFVVYMGNNEVLGPYGASNVFGQQVPGRSAVALSVAARSSRIGQLARNLAQGAGGQAGATEWRGMEMFLQHQVAADDPRLESIYRHFEANLGDMLRTARDAAVPMILCTVPVNLRNCSPLGSAHAPDLGEEKLGQWQAYYQNGKELEALKHWSEAADQYARAAAIDDHYADLHFRRGYCALALGDSSAALRHYEAARDLDTLRFRADSRINDIIRGMSDADHVSLVDADKGFKQLPELDHGIPGNEFFYEHVHFTFEGNYQLARMVFEQTVAQFGETDVSAPSPERCSELLGLSGADCHRMASSMMNLVVGPPFTQQLNYEENCANLYARIQSLEDEVKPPGLDRAHEVLRKALEARPRDWSGRVALARLHLARMQGAEAELAARELLDLLPDRSDLHMLLGQAMIFQGQDSKARQAFENSIKLATLPAQCMMLIADIYHQAGDVDQALSYCQRALKKHPDSAGKLARLAELLMEQGERAQALEHLQMAEALQPDHAAVLFNLARACFESGDREEAVTKLRAVLATQPFHLDARMQLGLILKKQGNVEEAAQLLDSLVAYKPKQLMLRLHLAEALTALRKLSQARDAYREALKVDPRNLNAMMGLAWVMAVNPESTPEQLAEAVSLAEQVVTTTRRRSTQSLDILAAAQAAIGDFEEAELTALEAWGMARRGPDKAFADAVSGRVDLYREQKRYHLPDTSIEDKQ